jgi:nucleoside-diphosphate-sugar epimerase
MTEISNSMRSKVLITGIDSFTGQHLSLYLKNRGYNIYGTSKVSGGNKVYKCDITIKEDVLNIIKDVKPDYLIHLAGISFVAHNNNNDFYRVNSIGSINILDAFIKAKHYPKKILMVSSATVYGNQKMESLDESLCCKPTNHYGASKYSMECLTSAYFQKLNILIARPFNYTGIGHSYDFLIPKIIKHYKDESKTIELGNIDVTREFNDVEFVCEAYRRLLECETKSKIVNIASGRGVKLLSVIEHMNDIAKYKINVAINPFFVRKHEIDTLVGSSKLLFDLVGEVEQKDFRQTLRAMYEA